MTEVLPNNFIRTIIDEDIKTGKHTKIITRFPPEPNGYLHIGHAKAICLNFGLASEFNGECNLRFDDTNPEKESEEYAKSIEEGIKWLGFSWAGDTKHASDYFDKLYQFAEYFIEQDMAYVCDLTPEQMRQYRGDFSTPGKNSPYRDPSDKLFRTKEENLALFRQMKNGDFPDGSKTLRLKIDMSSPNMNLRDPVIYRIKRDHHIRTGNKWCIYPMYDYTHCISDALEGITHSCCSLEFEDHRPLYDWVLDHLLKAGLVPCHPRQIEFSRLELQYTITSKRKLNQLVEMGVVDGWDDPRMPTLLGMRRRGYTPAGIRLFIERCGVSKSPNNVDMTLLEASVREDLEVVAPRIMAVLNPIKVVLTNFSAELTSSREAPFHPQRPELGSRLCTLTKEIYIEADDFQEVPEAGFQRLQPGGEVRLRHSYIIKCEEVIKGPDGKITQLNCSIDHNTLGKNPEGRKVKGVIHWVSCDLSINAEVRLYDRLFTEVTPDKMEGKDFTDFLNPNSLQILNGHIESAGQDFKQCTLQFERLGYFIADIKAQDKIIFNKTVALKDTWRK
ncbi:MAG: glutamine--tRNA ligase [Burkholderiales bacterium]|jgi:glutaminyl-tRNA synthetase|nr:glutamine--tRNA ligase [Burkholderiales bacterium]